MVRPKIMIVEDEKDLAADLADMLKNFGYTVSATLNSGEEAIRKASEVHPDIVLMDIHLRGNKDGIEAAREIYQNLHIPVVYLTAYSDPITLERAQASSPFGFILKPFQEKELVTVLEIAFKRSLEEESLKHSSANLGEIVEKINEGILIIDRKFNIRYMNQTARSFLDHQVENLIKNFSHESSVPKETQDVVIRHSSHSQGLGEWHTDTIEWEGEKVYLIIIHDVTKQRLLEKELRQAQKMEALGRLAGGIAHDFNNNLMVIDGYSEILLQYAEKNEEMRSKVEEIRRATQRSSKLVRQLLVFSRRQPTVRKFFNPNNLILDLEKMLQRLINENIKLIIRTDPQVQNIQFDPSQLEHILMNLAINARDAMPTGGALNIETKAMTLKNETNDIPSGEYVTISIRDTGTGMTEEIKSHLFEPFFTTKGEEKGTGLGLAMAYSLIKQNNGHIKVESEVEKGTLFQIYLPSFKETDNQEESKEPSSLPHGTETILLVEDEDALRQLAATMLRKQGYQVLEAKDGKEGLEKAMQYKKGKIDVLVTDVVMPEMSGLELSQNLEKVFPGMKVLFMSGYETQGNSKIKKSQNLAQTSETILQKPFTQKELASKVRKILNEKEKPSR